MRAPIHDLVPPGLYTRYGFRETGRSDVRMPDGVMLPCVAMDKPVGRGNASPPLP